MTIAESLGAPVSDPADPIGPTPDPCPLPTQGKRRETADRTRRHLLWSALVGAVALCVGTAIGTYAIPHQGALIPSARFSTAVAVPADVAGFAELFVATHLSGIASEDDLAVLYPAGRAPVSASGLWANRAATIGGSLVAENVWRLEVAADVLEMVDGVYQPAGIQYYSVMVGLTATQPVALSAPSRTPAPTQPHPLPGASRYAASVPPGQAEEVAGFLRAYLTGNGEVATYLAPAATIALFSAPPYLSVEITSLDADPMGRIRAQLTTTSAHGASQTLEYTLEMTNESGAWEVATLDPAP
ncbi:MAG: conjugal transfer protein [Acidimicrobiia bacterium]|nr:conjugal transfer protein [Acidimicrobiia bacterium]